MTSINSTILDPWGPISGILFGLDSDEVQRIVELAGLTPDWTLDEKQALFNTTRKRVFRARIGEAYSRLSDDKKRIFVLNAARELFRRGNQKRLNELLQSIGWIIVKDRLIPIDVLNPSDLINLPKSSHDDLTKAAGRLPGDLTGAITSACGAVDSVCSRVYKKYPQLGKADRVPFQTKVIKALEAVKCLDNLHSELLQLGWEKNDADIFRQNLKGAISQAANVMQSLRSKMGDVHGSKASLAILAFDSIKWAMIISSLLRETNENNDSKENESAEGEIPF